MWSSIASTLALLLALTAPVARAANCDLNQKRREGDVSAQKVVEGLKTLNNIDTVCAGTWRVADEVQLENSFSWWGMVWAIKRTKKEQPLRHCKQAMQDIMDHCIINGNYWGGSMSLDGETYTIQNSLYPANPILADGPFQSPAGPPKPPQITPPPQTPVKAEKYSTTTQTIQGLTANSATTTTINNHPTVLPIWFVKPNVGIIVIPAAGVIPGGVVPPPPGYPHLSIGPDGRPSSIANEDKEHNKHPTPSPKPTPPPQTPVKAEKFSTTTKTIQGLTANSATTTTLNNHPTVLPIWFVKPNVGIIVIPAAGVIPGGVVPPPPGYPHLSIGPDGRPSSIANEDKEHKKHSTPSAKSKPSAKSSTSSTSTSSCETCSKCALGPANVQSEPSDIADIPADFPLIIPGGETPSGQPIKPTPPPAKPSPKPEPAKQSAVPITEPHCNKNDAQPAPEKVKIDSGDIDYKDLLFRIRQKLCAGHCAAPDGVRAEVVNIQSSPDGQSCSISVRVSQKTEAYAFRTSAPVGDQLQQCWDSTKNIIDKCMKNNVFVSKQKSNEGWWNGNHVSQFYQVGLRSWKGAPGPWWLPPAGITHQSDACLYHYPLCTGYSGKPAQSVGRRNMVAQENNQTHELSARRPMGLACDIQVNLPDYPKTSHQLFPGSANAADNIPAISKWWEPAPRFLPSGECTWYLHRFDTRDINNNMKRKYETEHVWEQHFIKTFLNWLIYPSIFYRDQMANCDELRGVFDTLSQTPNSPFKEIKPAQALVNALSCYGRGCTDNGRVSEFTILDAGINNMKTRILGALSRDGGTPTPAIIPEHDHSTMRDRLIEVSMVFAYMNEPHISQIFNKVNDRMRAIIKQIDADPFYKHITPKAQKVGTNPQSWLSHTTWIRAYDYWLSSHLHHNQMKSDAWVYDMAMVKYPKAIMADKNLSEDEKKRKIAYMAAQREKGILAQSKIAFGNSYQHMMGLKWKVRDD